MSLLFVDIALDPLMLGAASLKEMKLTRTPQLSKQVKSEELSWAGWQESRIDLAKRQVVRHFVEWSPYPFSKLTLPLFADSLAMGWLQMFAETQHCVQCEAAEITDNTGQELKKQVEQMVSMAGQWRL